MVRGAWGTLLRRLAPPEIYRRLFEPGAGLARGPSGLADWPRPFVFRSTHLDGVTVSPGSPFFFDAHVFDLQQPVLPYFRQAFARLANAGIGLQRGRARLERVEQLDLDDRAQTCETEPGPPCSVPLNGTSTQVDAVTVRFLTPTELKIGGQLADRPEFSVLFSRLRDRISTLRSLYGAGALALDFRGLGERASLVKLGRCDLLLEHATRRSTRTGQAHSLGGFTGEAEYQGPLTEFLPWLRAARWVGVGRQTVWGKGDLRVIREHLYEVDFR